MAKQPTPGHSAYGAALLKATEWFVPLPRRLYHDSLMMAFVSGRARFALRHRWTRRWLIMLLERRAPGILGATLCRTCAIDDSLKAAVDRGLRTVVILGAGFDTRAYRLPWLAQTRVFELDLPSVQAFKKKRLLETLGALPQHVRFVPVDLGKERLEVSLARAGLGEEEPAVFIWEGVSQYLTPEAVDAVLRMIAARPKGSELVFTYILEEVVTGRFRPGPGIQALRKSASRRPEPWHFGIEPSQLETFLSERGLTLWEDLGAEQLVERYVRPLGRKLAVSEIARVARAGVPGIAC